MAAGDHTVGADDVLVLGGSDGGRVYLGGPSGGFLGPQAPHGYRFELRLGGESLTLDSFTSMSVKRRHTALSDFQLTIPMPADGDLMDWLLADIRLLFGDSILFRGRLDTIDGDLFAPVAALSGNGIGVELTRGEIVHEWRNTEYWEAIREVWRQDSDFSTTVLPPEDPNHPGHTEVPPSNEYSGTPMEILQQLHEESGMRFSVLHAKPGKNAVSYVPGDVRRDHADRWEVLDGSRQASAAGYANRVTVTGAVKEGATGTTQPGGEGEHVYAEAKNEVEIAQMRQRGVGNDGVVTYPIQAPGIGDALAEREEGVSRAEYYRRAHAEALAKAKSKLAELADKDTVGGSLDIWPAAVVPGFQYRINQFSGQEPRAYGEGPYGSGPYGGAGGDWASLESVSYSVSRGERSCSLDFSRVEGLAETIRSVRND